MLESGRNLLLEGSERLTTTAPTRQPCCRGLLHDGSCSELCLLACSEKLVGWRVRKGGASRGAKGRPSFLKPS